MRHFFIVGCPRSGTTMLQQALNRHSKIVIPPETKVFCRFYRQRRSAQQRYLRRLNSDLGISLPDPAHPIADTRAARKFFASMARAYLTRLGRDEVAWFGEKTPEHTSRLDLIRHVFPGAKLLFLYRDGRDVALSLSRMPWIRCGVLGGFAVWLYYYRILKRVREHGHPDVLFVRYEDLVTEPSRELQRVADYLGLSYEQAMAEGSGNCEGIPVREYAWKHRALQRITPGRVGLWRRELSRREVANLEAFGSSALADLGYELSSSAPRMTWSFRYQLASDLIRCAWNLPWRVLLSEIQPAAEQMLWRSRRFALHRGAVLANRPFDVPSR